MSAVPLPDVKQHLNITTNSQDDELQATIYRAEKILERRVGPLEPVTVTGEVHTGPGPIVLNKYPVISVSAATNSGVAVSDLVLDADSGVVYGTFNCIARAATVTYVAGRDELPEDLAAAVLELTKHLWYSQRGAGSAVVPGSLPGEDVQPGSSYLLPYRVQSLIEPFLLPTVA